MMSENVQIFIDGQTYCVPSNNKEETLHLAAVINNIITSIPDGLSLFPQQRLVRALLILAQERTAFPPSISENFTVIQKKIDTILAITASMSGQEVITQNS